MEKTRIIIDHAMCLDSGDVYMAIPEHGKGCYAYFSTPEGVDEWLADHPNYYVVEDFRVNI